MTLPRPDRTVRAVALARFLVTVTEGPIATPDEAMLDRLRGYASDCALDLGLTEEAAAKMLADTQEQVRLVAGLPTDRAPTMAELLAAYIRLGEKSAEMTRRLHPATAFAGDELERARVADQRRVEVVEDLRRILPVEAVE